MRPLSRSSASSSIRAFIDDCPDASELAEKFWRKNIVKIKPFYADIHKDDDVIVSASFGFMLRPVMQKLGVTNLLCSEVNLETGEITRLCFRRNKKTLFEASYPSQIENFYTDSLNDMPLMEMARNTFLVRGGKIEKWRGKNVK